MSMSVARHLTRILVVNENETLRQTLRAALEANGHDVIDAGDGIDALTILCLADDPLVVIVGAHLPDMEAEDLLNIVTQDSHLRSKHAFIVLAEYAGDPSPALARYLAHLGIPVLVRAIDEQALTRAVVNTVAQLRLMPNRLASSRR
ncbi:MAG: hypothetical protein ACRDHP_09430 [Ktedonobacterales bacterium]